MSVLSDEELVILAKEDKEYLNQLVERYKGFVSRLTTGYTMSGYTKEDFLQEGFIALCNAVKSFDPSKHTKFSTYLTTCIKNKMKDIIKSGNYEKRKTPPTISLDETIGEEDNEYHDIVAADTRNPEERLLAREELAETIAMLKKKLSPFEYKVFVLFLADYSYEEMTKILSANGENVTKKQIDNALQRVRLKIKAQVKLWIRKLQPPKSKA